MFDFTYSVRRQKNRRTTSILVHPEKGVVITAPSWVPDVFINSFISQKQDWIKKNLAKFKALSKVTKAFTSGEKHLYFGEGFPLRITRSPVVRKIKLSLLYDTFEALIPTGLTPYKEKLELKLAFTDWYLKQGKKIITQKVDYFAKKLKVSYNRLTLKRVSSIWGSCSHQNNLNFNRKLIMAPHPVVDYVIIHEVCHLIHRHHRPSFWKEVAALDPSFKDHLKWLKQNHYLLTL